MGQWTGTHHDFEHMRRRTLGLGHKWSQVVSPGDSLEPCVGSQDQPIKSGFSTTLDQDSEPGSLEWMGTWDPNDYSTWCFSGFDFPNLWRQIGLKQGQKRFSLGGAWGGRRLSCSGWWNTNNPVRIPPPQEILLSSALKHSTRNTLT